MVLAHDLDTTPRTQDVQTLSSSHITFESMLLKKKTQEGLDISGFEKPSPIQLHGIPLGKCGFDLFLEAKSGTGKTAVFTVVALEKLDLQKDLQAVILTPTREIAAQINDVIKQIGSAYKGLNVEVVMGGLPVEEDIEKFKKPVHILVGSPGRMRQLIQEQHVNISAVRLFVLDEADKLMEKSFQSDINYIFSVLPKQKQVIMSSATYPETLKSIMENYVQKVQHIRPDTTAILLGIKQLVTIVKCHPNVVRQTQLKFQELLRIISQQEFKQCLIFCNYQVRVVEVCKMLVSEKWPAQQLHSQLEQNSRLDALKTLQEYKCRILVSTDLAARGIDASNVDLVINFEAPFEWQIYLHRMGRAGRFGSYGIAVTILSEGKEVTKFKTMVNNINSSLNIKNLWDDSKFDLDYSVANKCTPHKKGAKIPKAIPSTSTTGMPIPQEVQKKSGETLEDIKYEDDKCNIDGLSMLFNSVEKFQEFQIETFGDLMASLDTHHQSDHENETEVLNLPKSMLAIKTDSNISPSDEVACDSQQETSVKNYDNSSPNLIDEKNTKPVDKTPISPEDASNQSALVENPLDISDSQMALAGADLPSTSGSTKHHNKNDLNQSRKYKKSGGKKQKPDEKSKESKIESIDDLTVSIEGPSQNDQERGIPKFTFTRVDLDDPNIISSHQVKCLRQGKGVKTVRDSVENLKDDDQKQISPPKDASDQSGTVEPALDIDDSSRALMEAGLPTAFSSSKHNNKNKFNQVNQDKNKKSVALKQNKEIKTSLCLDTDKLNRKQWRETNSKKYIKTNADEHCAQSSSQKPTRTEDQLMHITNYYSYETKLQRCDEYSKWYRQLKTHIKQVEMSLLIGELTNI